MADNPSFVPDTEIKRRFINEIRDAVELLDYGVAQGRALADALIERIKEAKNYLAESASRGQATRNGRTSRPLTATWRTSEIKLAGSSVSVSKGVDDGELHLHGFARREDWRATHDYSGGERDVGERVGYGWVTVQRPVLQRTQVRRPV
jgi:hypothetical protein